MALIRFFATAGALALGSLLVASPATAAAPETCQFAPTRQIDIDTGAEPQLLINGTCVDPDYNESSFVIDKTESLTFQIPGGPLVPYTQVTAHFPAMATAATLPPNVRSSPKTDRQDYILRFPAKEFFKHRSFQQEHPTSHGQVDNRMAFVNGAFTVNAVGGSAVATHRHHAAATKIAKAYANKLYGDTGRIYSYYWGCSGGGTVAMAAAENVTGVWDGIEVQCTGTNMDAQYHSFQWQALYTMAIPEAKRKAIAEAAVAGGTGDIYAGLNDEEKSVLTEFLAAGYPVANLVNQFANLTPLVSPAGIRAADLSYEEDFWSKPGYAGVNPPNYLKAALVDGYATIKSITRNDAGAPTVIEFDPATVPKLGSIGDANMNFYVYAADGVTRTMDLSNIYNPALSLGGKLDTARSTLTLTGRNNQALLSALTVGGKIRINNRFFLAIYYYPRYSIIPGVRSHDQYRNADGSPKYPQRANISALTHSSYRTMGGRTETGDIKTRTIVISGISDNLSWPIFNVRYAEMIEKTLGPTKANEMMRVYLHDNGRHGTGGGEPGVFQQSIQDLIAWVEKGVAPPPSTRYEIKNSQVVLAPAASDRHGLQPVMSLSANGVTRATVGVNQPVNLVSRLEMPPKTGQIVQYGWTIDGKADPATVVDKPQTLVKVSRTMTFDKPGSYLVRLTVNGQRDGLVAPANMALPQNFREVRVVVQ